MNEDELHRLVERDWKTYRLLTRLDFWLPDKRSGNGHHLQKAEFEAMYRKAMRQCDVPAVKWQIYHGKPEAAWRSLVESRVRWDALNAVKREDIVRDVFSHPLRGVPPHDPKAIFYDTHELSSRPQKDHPHSFEAHLRFSKDTKIAGWTWSQFQEQCNRAFARIPRNHGPHYQMHWFDQTNLFREITHPPGASAQQSRLLETAVKERAKQLNANQRLNPKGLSWLDAELNHHLQSQGATDYAPHRHPFPDGPSDLPSMAKPQGHPV